MKPALALYQPDIPQNTATLLRTGACLSIPVHIILPAGFTLSNKNFRRAGLDYVKQAELTQHASWSHFLDMCEQQKRRIVLLTTKAETAYTDFRFSPQDVLLLGRESAGVPTKLHETIKNRIKIPMHADTRSLNIAIAGAMVLGEALRQCQAFPKL